jgi:hypothetical protein
MGGHAGTMIGRDGQPGLAAAGYRLAESSMALAEVEFALTDQGVGAVVLRRYSVGVMPVSALKARLNGPSDWNPASSAIVKIGTSAWSGSTSARFTSDSR